MPRDKKVTWNLPPTLEEFFKNPSGKGVTANNISSVRHTMDSRYEILTKKLKKKFPVTIFEENENSYYFLIIVPSDMRDYDYDVVIHLYNVDDNVSSSLKKWHMEIFSNCPSFVFTYAYAYNLNGLMIPFLSKKLGKACTTMPTERNPDLQVGWDKSVYYAIKYLMSNIRLTQRFMVKREAVAFDAQKIFDLVRPFSTIMSDLETKKKDRAGVIRGFSEARNRHSLNNIKKEVSKKVKSVVEKSIEKKNEVTKGIVNHNYNSKGKVVGKSSLSSRAKITGSGHRKRKK